MCRLSRELTPCPHPQIDKAFMDLTDKENKSFRYPL
jgi:hypothetical protein